MEAVLAACQVALVGADLAPADRAGGIICKAGRLHRDDQRLPFHCVAVFVEAVVPVMGHRLQAGKEVDMTQQAAQYLDEYTLLPCCTTA